uniref:Light-independent protochlorophyllide reductase subunit B n=1 Tax=Anthurium amnicola TaxID=1678845 RepID=A0A1D1XGH2_9ARAE
MCLICLNYQLGKLSKTYRAEKEIDDLLNLFGFLTINFENQRLCTSISEILLDISLIGRLILCVHICHDLDSDEWYFFRLLHKRVVSVICSFFRVVIENPFSNYLICF